ncbi:MAG: hypothetical protein NC828_06690, partial [Candidatus Omnitrophica bacterium]|nr:hypothetical protein [Candidatus Omnitrophota bacterium]
FPKSEFKKIKSLKDFLEKRPRYTIRDYNRRRDCFFVIIEKHDFFKKCPCTKMAVSCGYHIFNLGFGCTFECTYCYLQEYTNCPGIILPSNIEKYFAIFKDYKRPGMRIGTGEFTDSLAIDDITQYSIPLVDFFNKNKEIIFEFKTKSDNIANLVRARHEKNIVISWSLNPENVIRENEFYTASLENRLKAAVECVRAGYMVGFHFDPIIHYNSWENDYNMLVNCLFDKIPPKYIAWISLGTFRFKPNLKRIIENRFPNSTILDEELLMGFDNKLRYPTKIRYIMYKKMVSWLRKRAKNVPVYLCMEKKDIILQVLMKEI